MSSEATKIAGVVVDGEKVIDEWKAKNFLPLPRDEKWHTFKHRVCKAGDPLNPILLASGGEIEVEQFGIIGWLDEIELHPDCKVVSGRTGKQPTHFMQCSLVEARETGTGKFGEWLESVKKFCRDEYDMPFALHNITNERLYKYCMKHNVSVSLDDGMLCQVRLQEDETT